MCSQEVTEEEEEWEGSFSRTGFKRLFNKILEREHMAEDWKGGLQRHKVHDPYNEAMGKSNTN